MGRWSSTTRGSIRAPSREEWSSCSTPTTYSTTTAAYPDATTTEVADALEVVDRLDRVPLAGCDPAVAPSTPTTGRRLTGVCLWLTALVLAVGSWPSFTAWNFFFWLRERPVKNRHRLTTPRAAAHRSPRRHPQPVRRQLSVPTSPGCRSSSELRNPTRGARSNRRSFVLVVPTSTTTCTATSFELPHPSRPTCSLRFLALCAGRARLSHASPTSPARGGRTT